MDDILPEIRVPVDLGRFSGQWFEVERSQGIPFQPDTLTDVRACYSWDGRRFGIRNEALSQDGRTIRWETHVTRILNAYNSRFEIAAPGAATRTGIYRILMLDLQDYQWAVVANGDDNIGGKQWIWVLCRERLMTRLRWEMIHAVLDDHFGVNLRSLQYTPHTRDDLPPCDTSMMPEVSVETVVPLGDDEYAVRMNQNR